MYTEDRHNSIGHEIKAINHVMQRQMIKSATKEGIDKVTIMHGWIIHYINRHSDEDIYQKDIESEFAISRSTVTNILKCMEKKGYIRRVSVDSDARLKKLVLTEKGVEVDLKLRNTIAENEKRFDSLLSAEEKEQFLTLIRKLRTGLKK